MKRILYGFLSLVLLISSSAQVFGQIPWALTGTVKNPTGERIAGASVEIEGRGSQKTVTDQKGEFTLENITLNDRIVIKHISYNSWNYQISEQPEGPINIVLEFKSMEIEEVVFSTGYEKVPRERATGSFEFLDSMYIERVPSPNVLSRVKNMISGVYFDQSGVDFNSSGRFQNENINIHGISSISGTNSPLIILDNFPYTGDINAINPNDIESITVLKDAAAASIWGAQAGNGVIVMTTKKGKRDSKINTTFSHYTIMGLKPDLRARPLIGNDELVRVQEFLYDEGFYSSNINARARPSLPMAIEILEQKRKGVLSDAEATQILQMYGNTDIRDEMLQHLYRNSINQQYALSLDGGADRHVFRFSLGLDRATGTRVKDSNERYAVRLADNIKLSDNLDIDLGFQWSKVQGKSSQNVNFYSNSGYQHPYLRLRDDNGAALPVPHNYSLGYVESLSASPLLDWVYRPMDELESSEQRSSSSTTLMNGSVSYRLKRWFSFNLRYQYENIYNNDRGLHTVESIRSRNIINLYSQVAEDGSVTRPVPLGGILESTNMNMFGHTGRFQVNFEHRESTRHHISSLVGMEIINKVSETDGNTLYGYDDDKLSFYSQMDHFNRFPTFDNLGSTASISNYIAKERFVNRFVSLYSNASYTFDGKYTLTASMRRDASNIFGLATNDKWNPLWSTGVSWLISKEDFFRGSNVDMLKLRATFGYSGNIDPSRSGNTTLSYGTSNTVYGINWPSATILVAPNPLLRWEKIQNYNIGLDVGFFGNRLTGSFDFYKKKSFDLIHTYPLDPTVGIISQAMNVADARSRGVDIRLGAKVLDQAVKLKIDKVFTYNNNWIDRTFVDYPGPNTFMSSSIIAYEGAMPYGLYSFRFAGLDPETGEPMGFVDGEASKEYNRIQSSQTTMEDLVLHGSARPTYYGSLINFISYRNLDLSFSLGYKLGYYFRRPSINYNNLFSRADGHIDYLKRWQQPGDEEHTTVPSMRYPLNRGDGFYHNSDVLVERGDHIRLNDLRLQYNFLQNTSKIKKLSMYLYATNLGIIWKKTGYVVDPEVGGNIPAPRQYTIGLNLNF